MGLSRGRKKKPLFAAFKWGRMWRVVGRRPLFPPQPLLLSLSSEGDAGGNNKERGRKVFSRVDPFLSQLENRLFFAPVDLPFPFQEKKTLLLGALQGNWSALLRPLVSPAQKATGKMASLGNGRTFCRP